MIKPSLFELSKAEILDLEKANPGFAKFRWAQLLDWLFVKRESDIQAMSNLPQDFKAFLQDKFELVVPEILEKQDAEDGATKLLLRTPGTNQTYEAVILRYKDRVSLCVSSQVGCKLACSFCQTGKLGFFKNLRAYEILGQFLVAQKIVAAENRFVSHIVFMGMGEPLDNFDSVIKTVNLLIKDYGLSHRRVTLSTSGITPKIAELATQTTASLAVSLHACRDELRSELMPINRKYNLAELKKTLLEWQKQTNEKVTFEYILLKGVNSSVREAQELVKFLHGFRAKVNLIPFNEHPGSDYERPSEEEIKTFQEYLSQRSIPAPVRYSKGLDVSAACGQLAAKDKMRIDMKPERAFVLNQVAS